jgi:integrase
VVQSKAGVGKVVFTAKRVNDFRCAADKPQAFLWDAKQLGLGVRVTPAGKPSYVFQGRYQGQSLRLTIGSTEDWSIPKAQAKAREYQTLIDEGRDPRQVKASLIASAVAKRASGKLVATTVGEAWERYLNERRPHWSENTYQDHLVMTRQAGKHRKNRPLVTTQAGLLVPFMSFRLSDLDASSIEKWVAKEAKHRPARVRLALRLLKAFLRWASHEEDYKTLVNPEAGSSKKIRELAGKARPKTDYLQREQLPAWFAHVRLIQNPVIAAYLQCLLLTGARREELAKLRWADVNLQWCGLTIGDKVEENRAIPLTPYVAQLLQSLPRRNQWVFSSPTSESGRLTEPSIAHRQACKAAGLELTLHGLRRSFKSLTEWLEVPVGVVAQLMGHKPSATAEKHYTVRPLDLLRVHHEKIEAWLLVQAGIEFVPRGAGLRAVL